jgi:cytoskeletal protein RodZ
MPNSIGQKLKEARIQAGLSLLDAAHETRIPAARIAALEADNFAAFGSMAYARSFLKNYSRFLEVDASETLDQFPLPVFGGPEDYRYLTRSHGAWVRRRVRHQPRAPLNTSRHTPAVGLVGLLFVLALAGAMVGTQLLGWQKTPEPEVSAAESKDPIAESKSAPVNAAAPTAVMDDKVMSAQPIPDLDKETVIRPAVIPSSIPAPISDSTPVRRPEIVE